MLTPLSHIVLYHIYGISTVVFVFLSETKGVVLPMCAAHQ